MVGGFLLLGFSIVEFLAWQFDLEWLRRPLPVFPAIFPWTILGFLRKARAPMLNVSIEIAGGGPRSQSSVRKTWQSRVGVVAVTCAVALGVFWLADPVSASDKKVIGVTLLSFDSPYVSAVADAMKVEAAIEGIDLVTVNSARSVTTELSQVEELIARKVDLIVMMAVDQKLSQTAAKLINKAGIPLVLLLTNLTDDFTSSGGKVATFVGSDDIVAGKIQGHYLADKLPAGGNVIYLVLEYGMSATARRKAGFESVLKDYPKLRVVTELQGHSSRANGQAVMESLLRKYEKGQLQALVAQNDEMAIGASLAIQAADRLGEFEVLIGINALRPGLEAVASGALTATVLQDAVAQGTQAVVVANRILSGEAVEKQLLIPFQLVTKENVSSFK
jgi:inositol transport system substrate-binding protein